VDTEEDKRMGIGDGGNGTRTARRHDQKKEIIILWTRDEKGDCLFQSAVQPF